MSAPYFGSYYGYPGYGYPVGVESPDVVGPGTYDRPSDTAARQYSYTGEPSREPTARRPSEEEDRYYGRRPSEEEDRYGERYLDLRDREQRPSAPPPEMPHTGLTTANGSDTGTPTVLIFRDGHKSEINNYAIMDSTIFILSGERKKIPLSELDVPATVAENDRHGVDFRIPPPAKSKK